MVYLTKKLNKKEMFLYGTLAVMAYGVYLVAEAYILCYDTYRIVNWEKKR
jgi:hypothetical protein